MPSVLTRPSHKSICKEYSTAALQNANVPLAAASLLIGTTIKNENEHRVHGIFRRRRNPAREEIRSDIDMG